MAEVVRHQAETGVFFDIVTDGEQGQASFITYVGERLTGFEPRDEPPEGPDGWRSREEIAFPEYYEWYARGRPRNVAPPVSMGVCTGPHHLQGQQALQTDIANLNPPCRG